MMDGYVLGFGAVVLVVAVLASIHFRAWRLITNHLSRGGRNRAMSEASSSGRLALAALRSEAAVHYNTDNASHEQMLEDLWALLKPGVKRDSRLSEQWSDIGFQGKDPATDFRGMGVLSLKNLVFFARHFPKEAAAILRAPGSPNTYPFAAAGINLTSHLLHLLKQHPELLNTLFPGNGEDVLGVFSELFCEEWIAFDDFYQLQVAAFLKSGGEPALAIMEFNRIRTLFFDQQLKIWDRRIKASDGRVGLLLQQRALARTRVLKEHGEVKAASAFTAAAASALEADFRRTKEAAALSTHNDKPVTPVPMTPRTAALIAQL
jgi:hypothetical protein